MHSIKLKVCGMTNEGNILEVASRHPDFMGFIFYKTSPRYVGEDFIIPSQLDERVKRVGVFVNEKVSAVIEKVKQHKLDLVQLHGEETPAHCQQLKESGVSVIKVFSIGNEFDFSTLEPFEPFVDYFLFDTKGELRGGTGVPFNWNMLKSYVSRIPYFLSGGIISTNIKEIPRFNNDRLFAIDVNSGVEDYPGFKNKKRLDELVEKFKILEI